MNRREFINMTVAGATVGPALLFSTQVQSKVSIGAGSLTTVTDGHLVLPKSFVLGDLPVEEAVPIIEAAGHKLDGLESPCNLTLWEFDDNKVLFDAGAGPDFMNSAGQVQDSLESLGLSPEDITHVVFTHCHPDHLWGSIDDFDEPLFLNAKHYLGVRERDYWLDPATVDTIGQARQSFAAGALRRLDILESVLKVFDAGDEVLPGLTAVPTPGHTPGHMSFRLDQGDSSAFIVGDAIVNEHLALARPEWPSPSDQDQELGVETRMNLLEELSSSEETFIGFHFSSGGIGKISKESGEYWFSPKTCVNVGQKTCH